MGNIITDMLNKYQEVLKKDTSIKFD